MNKSLTVIVFILIVSCKNTDYFSNRYGKIITDDIVKVEYYEGGNYLESNPNKKPIRTFTDKNKISEIITLINNANNPSIWKGAQWDKVLIVKADTTLIYNTNGKVIGVNQNSGFFYKLNNDTFILQNLKI